MTIPGLEKLLLYNIEIESQTNMENDIEKKNNEIEEYTMDIGRVNLIALIMIIPITAMILIPFLLIWDYETFKTGKDIFMDYFLIYLLGGIIIHELLHGLSWGYFASKGLKSIKFGGAMPLIVMGIIPSIIGLIFGHGGILSFGIFFTWAAGGDIIALYMLRKLDNNIYVSDHPEKMGFVREI